MVFMPNITTNHAISCTNFIACEVINFKMLVLFFAFRINICNCKGDSVKKLKMESIRKLSNFNSSVAKNLESEYFKLYRILFYTSQGL